MTYLYETHCHASRCSRCAHSAPAQLVEAYREAGYAGLVLTDHFVLGNTAVDRSLPWEAQIRKYHEAYLEAKEAARGLDFDVIFSIEHACEGAEYLCYGITPDFLLSHPQIPELSLADFAQLAHQHGVLVIQAHPYRWAPAGTALRWDLLDGIEVFNASNDDRANDAARAAVRPGTILTSGGDIHRADDPRIGSAGIRLPYRVSDEQALANALRQGHHRLHLP